MSWNSIKSDKKSHKEQKDFLKNEFSDNRVEVIDLASKSNVWYMAIRYIYTKKVFAVVVVVKSTSKEFMWKTLDEFMEPFYYDCPKKILNLLSELNVGSYGYKNAKMWRLKCWAKINKN